jgi:hypothetical protein
MVWLLPLQFQALDQRAFGNNGTEYCTDEWFVYREIDQHVPVQAMVGRFFFP